MLNYTTEEKVEQFLNVTIDGSVSAQIDGWAAAMSRFADKYCNRTLMVEESEVRKFSGIGSSTLHIDEACEIVSVTPKGGSVIASTDLLEYPLNRPHTVALFREGGRFDKGNANYDVDAFYGYIKAETVDEDTKYAEETPEELQTAVTMLVAGLVNLSRNGGDNVQSEKVGMYSYTVKDLENKEDYKIAIGLLDQFKKLAF